MSNPSNLNRRQQTTASIALGIGIGLTLGAALDNIALGLAIGILMGGLGALWRRRNL